MDFEYLLGAVLTVALTIYLVYALSARALLKGRSMTVNGWLQIAVFFLAVLALTKPLGVYMYRVFEGDEQPLPRLFGPDRAAALPALRRGPEARAELERVRRLAAVFSAVGLLVTYAIQRLQQFLPLNPAEARAGRRRPGLQHGRQLHHQHQLAGLRGETTMSYLTQMAGLAWHNFTSAAAGIGVALALARGLTRRPRARTAAGRSATSGST